MTLLDQHLAQYQFCERHQRPVAASAAQVMQAVHRLPDWQDPWVQRFIRLRELPARLAARLGHGNALPQRAPFGLHDFTLLQCNAQEVVWGLAGEFWRGDYGLRPLADAAAFAGLLSVPRLVMGIRIIPLATGELCLHTETRVYCPDRRSYYRFMPYWYLIRPVSGLIRQRMLRAIAEMALTA
ncbi:hypothetical protein [Vogesella oryzae]|uniref:hypothetical protein n=1 Tax=Vogesella oryzae TaxID=1735285 RepID=UPI0015821288|nr:hypothetical protein [Vogesella oryzae]